ncbi:hypothetical protein O181_039095 [Austropuccinia psidii MF-1]|uniref:Uncharacterized protein n=1 Tax=Austropuccinia psidii MF-1 TaxID=1389203 RepID=A0A9Q3DAY7_9BASI|nr:hypothetical protein [Austropuccinia psidii MF-1]
MDADAEVIDELDHEEVEVVLNSSGNQSSTSPSQPPGKRFQSQIIPSTPRNFQPVLSSIPSSIPLPSPSPSTARPSLVSTVRPSPMVPSQQLQPVASSSRRIEDLSPLPFPSAQVFQKKEHWPIWVTREDPNMENECQDSVARLFRREVIMYANYRTIPGTASE